MKVSFDNPFFDQLTSYAGRFAHPVWFGPPSNPCGFTPLANGTGTLLKFGDLYVGVTCQHVLEGYRKRKREDSSVVFQFTTAMFEPDDYLIQENRRLDIATLNLSMIIDDVISHSNPGFIEPPTWPPGDVSTEDVIAFAGYPGNKREHTAPNYTRFYFASSGTSKVHSVAGDVIVTRMESEKAITRSCDGKIMGSLGGMSGGPVFAWRNTGLLRAEIVGFIWEYQESLDLLYIRAAKVLREDGTLVT